MKINILSIFVICFLFIQLSSNQVNAQVVANFSSTPIAGCAPLTVTFKDLSTGSPTSWSWTFGNGNTSSSQNTSAAYLTAGTYTVTLVAKGSSNSTKTSTIVVYANPVANFTTSALPSCVGQTVTFTDTSIPGSGTLSSWKWDFGDGTPSGSGKTTTHIYSGPGTFVVSLIITDIHGCTNSIPKNVTIIASPKASFTGTPLSSCTAPLIVNFTNTSTGTGLIYSWTFGDGTAKSTATSPSHTYAAVGSYTVKLVVTQGGCKDSIVKINYVVVQKIAANFSSNVISGCVGTAVTFTDTSVPLSTSSTWNFGDGTPTSTLLNPTHTYTAPGTYTVSLNATANGCSDSKVQSAYITIFPSPVVAFTANNTQSCKAPFTVIFTDQSTNGASWVWNFGDGTPTSSSQNPSHTYNASGTYSVTLTVTSAKGCVTTLVKTNYIIIAPPIANFTATPLQGCAPLLVNFTSTSTSIDPITNYKWTFGNGTSGNTASPTTSSTYTAGTYTVKLVITTAQGCKDSITKISYIKAGVKPVAKFTIVDSTVCYGVLAQFHNLSTGTPPPDSAFWQFGDGGTLPVKPLPGIDPVTHFYNDTGKYTVTLIVSDRGCTDTLIQKDIVRILPPKPIFTFQLNCINPYSVKFTDASIGADSIVWDFGDGTPKLSNVLAPTHIYTARGSKTVTLTAYNKKTGCSFFMTKTFIIAEPIANYTATLTGCYPFPVTFSNTSQDGVGFTWIFGDGSPNSLASTPPIHTYALPGTYTVQLTIRDINGCTNTKTDVVKAQGPTPDFKADTTTGCAPLPIIFTDKSVSDSTLVQWIWDFGDGSAPQTVTTPTINHTYMLAGAYSVTMTVKDKNGCSKTITKTNYIIPTFPIPKFVVAPFGCKNVPLTFNATTTNAVAPATYSWNFGDGTTGAGVSITHGYLAQNTYTITLVVKDKNGCTDSIKHQVLIEHPVPIFDTTMISQSCGNSSIQFHDKSTGSGSPFIYSWDFGDGGGAATSQNPFKTYTVPGTYTVTLTITNSAGCSTTITKNNYVTVPGPVGTFSFTPNNGCRPLTVTFTATSNNADIYQWDFGDGHGITTSSKTVTYTYKDPSSVPIIPKLILGDTLSDGSFCKSFAPTPGTITITSPITVTINPKIITVEEDETVTINPTVLGTSGTSTYLWTPPTNLSCTDCKTTNVTGDGSGATITYYFTVTDPGGCVGNDSITIIFPPCTNDKFLIPNVFTPNGDLINDLYDISGLCKKNTYLLRIYNRWGQQVFTTEDRKISWNGKMNNSGQDVPDGVYYYLINLDDKPTYTGFVQVLR